MPVCVIWDMTEVSLVFPHQLYESSPALIRSRQVVLIEDALFFSQYKFHKKKIVLHRASMKAYESELTDHGYTVHYLDVIKFRDLSAVFTWLKEQGIRTAHYAEADDYLLERRLSRFSIQYDIKLNRYQSNAFLCSVSYLDDYFSKHPRYFLNNFYIDQRKRFNILIQDDKPIGGQWNFDVENRKKIPAQAYVPERLKTTNNKFVREACAYVRDNFSDHYGTLENFSYPVTRQEALRELDDFLEKRFEFYGIYQDAIVSSNSFLFHSVLTPALNIGLITPAEIVDRAIAFSESKKIPLNSLEGFIRQIIGWREFIRAIYVREGTRLRKSNHWNHDRPIPQSLWTGTTGILPVDQVIKGVTHHAYSNHIERLMIIGNFMLLCEFRPDDIYRWFMEFYIDSYDWVMVPNVYGMSQYAAGGFMSTKPYISGSNYILKMSNYKKEAWCDTWDALYWTFIQKHREEFLKNPRMSMMVRQYDKIDNSRKIKLQHNRELFLVKL